MGAQQRPQAPILGVNSKSLVYNSFNLDTELNKVNPVKALTSGKITSDYIGKTVYISNDATSCQEWIIIDTNHDDTSGTVDLFPKYTLESESFLLETIITMMIMVIKLDYI